MKKSIFLSHTFKTLPAVAMFFALVISSATAQAQSLQIKQLAASCAACHGTDGYSVGGMASLAGQSKNSIIEKMAGYKNGKIDATIMHQLSKGYSDEQIEKIAEYFASLPQEKPAVQPAGSLKK
jgi:cytochrome c553